MMSRSLRYAGIGYVGLVVAALLVAGSGLLPGTGEVGPPSFLGHPYRVAMAAICVLLAVYLGVWSGAVGIERRNWTVGLGALLIGGLVTGAALVLAPYVLYAHDQYPVAFMWTVGAGPLGLLVWLAITATARLSGWADTDARA